MDNSRPAAAPCAIALGLLFLSALSAGCHSAESASAEHALHGCSDCTVLTGGTVFDGTRAGRGVVVLKGDRVQEVVFGDVDAVKGHRIDVSGKTVLPGLLDLHVHSMSPPGPYDYYDDSPHIEEYMKSMLRWGVTTYLALGSSTQFIFDYRAKTRAGAFLSPQLFAAGPLFTPTGGHPCYDSPPGDFCIFTDSPSDVAKHFPALVAKQPDLIKIVLEKGSFTPLPELSAGSVAAIAEAATAADLRVIAHVSTGADIETAIASGVKLFAHIPFEERITPELAQKMAAAKVVVVPTLSFVDGLYRISHGTLTELDDPALGDDVQAGVIDALRDPERVGYMQTEKYKARTQGWMDNARANLMMCHDAGVTIASGTDAGNPGVFHGLAVAREIALYVESGMQPLAALVAGTRAAADMLKKPELGRLAPGALADVLVVEGDAIADVHALRNVARVFKSGVEIDRAALGLPRKN
jgi:imidazolonepropionase-like amidohydrolase